MSALIYFLCSLTALSCSWLLFRSYMRTRTRLLFWSGMCFAVLTVNNVLLIIDRLVLPAVDLLTLRLLGALLALCMLLYGLIYEKE